MTKEVEISLNSLLFLIFLLFLIYTSYLSFNVVIKNPISFGDEGFHTSLGRYIALEKEYPKYIPFEGSALIKDGFYRPPLWNLILASFIFLFGINETIIKTITILIHFFLGLSTYVLVKRIFEQKIAIISSILLVSFQSVLTYTVLFYYALLLLFFVNLSLLCFLIYIKESDKKFLILSSVFASLALLTNQFAISIYGIYMFYIFLKSINNFKNIKEIIKEYSVFILILLIIPSGYLIRNTILYQTPICFSIPFIKNLFDISNCKVKNFEEKYSFVGQAIPIGTEAKTFSIGFMNYLEFAYFDTKFVILPLLVGLFLLYFEKNRISNILLISFIFYTLLMIELGNTRAEDTARYSLGFASLISLIAAIAYGKILDFSFKINKYLPYIIILFILVVCLYVARNRLEVLNNVKRWDPSFFEACNWIKFNTEKNATIATIWGHNGAWCSERNMGPMLADILLSYDLNYILEVVEKNKIDYFWIQKASIDPLNRGYAGNYPIKFIRILVENPQYFIKVYENGDKIESCYQTCYGQTIYKINITKI